uniref:Sodium/myo-inositol cotransporter 2 n=1 Tax=Saccoglossus kowalevskii TaxID=10224 RepID=A0ABM0MJC3_SACKO|nr:PREDICTED: low affinity sodium-glucose cotransporter-like [Saccoglossus kowalevskii]
MAIETHKSDIALVAVYISSVIVVGFLSCKRSNRGTNTGFLLTGRNTTFLSLGLSLFATNLGAGYIIGVSSLGAAWGVAVAAYPLMSILSLLLLGWGFGPVYMASGAKTLPEYLSLRYGGERLTVFMSVFSIILYVFTRIAVNIYGLVIFIKYTFDWNLYYTIIGMVALVTLITAVGGMKSVLYTGVLYTPIIIIGAVVLAAFAFMEAGGYSGLTNNLLRVFPAFPTFFLTNASTCRDPSEDAFHIFHGLEDPNQPWLGTVLGVAIVTMWYWCSDQIMTQYIFAAKSLSHAKGSVLLAGCLLILPLFLIVIPGMLARMLYVDQVGCLTYIDCFVACRDSRTCFHIAYPMLVSQLSLPTGIRGLLLVTIMAASMSSLSSIFHGASTTFTLDIWNRVRGHVIKEWELIIVYRMFVASLAFMTIWWILVVQNFQGAKIFVFIQSMYSYFSPPLLVCFLLGVTCKKVNEEGAYWGMVFGISFGVFRTLMDVVFGVSTCERPADGPYLLHRINHLYFCIISTFICILVTLVISVVTKPIIPEHELARLTWGTRYDYPHRNRIESGKTLSKINSKVESEEIELNSTGDVTARKRRRKQIHKKCCIKSDIVETNMPSIVQEKKCRWILNIGALLLGGITLALFGFFH